MSKDWLSKQLPDIEEIQNRLKEIFPREVDVNGYIIREMGAKTVFTMLYCLCVEENEWIRPATITCMTDEQASIHGLEDKKAWLKINQSKDAPRDIPGRWYKPNTREPIRDETLREMVRLNALAVYTDNDDGNRFWERMGFRDRDFLRYKNKAFVPLEWYD